MSEDTRFSKLPKWAQEEITWLHGKLDKVTKEMIAARDNTETSLWHHDSLLEQKVFMPEKDKVVFQLIKNDRTTELTFTLQQDHQNLPPYIRVDAGWNILIVEAEGGVNAARLYPKHVLEQWLTNSN